MPKTKTINNNTQPIASTRGFRPERDKAVGGYDCKAKASRCCLAQVWNKEDEYIDLKDDEDDNEDP